jgi:hypothetical protein
MRSVKKSIMKSIEESIFMSPAFQALTIGVPFCTYKMLFGLLAGRIGLEQSNDLLTSLSGIILAWALVDLIMNLTRVVYSVAGRPSPIEYCIIAQLGRLFHSPRLFLAVDTLVSFSIICFVLWSGWIAGLRPEESYLWNGATTLNLISISFVNIWMELRRKHEAEGA